MIAVLLTTDERQLGNRLFIDGSDLVPSLLQHVQNLIGQNSKIESAGDSDYESENQ
jgi:hypothetical protein